MRLRAFPVPRLSALGLVASAALLAACASDIDTTRNPPPRGTLGTEMYGVICDRVGAQALHEDLTGASFTSLCHPAADGSWADHVDLTKLTALDPAAHDANGNPMPLAKQQADRAHAVARIETLAKHRADLIAALDFALPDVDIPVHDLGNPDPKKSCNPPAASGEARLHDALRDLLARFGPLYDDGTLPQSTESLARVMNAFKASTDAQAAYARLDARQGYRPVGLALGAARPVTAYPKMRDFANSLLTLLSADSKPYDLHPQLDAQGQRIRVPGAAYTQFSKLLEVAHGELRDAAPDPAVGLLHAPVVDPSGRQDLSRPRTNLEMMQEVLYATDPAFGGGPSQYIVRRDARGYALVPPVNGAVPPPFVDADGDGLADVDALGRFITSDGSSAPSPFFAAGLPFGVRDPAGRAVGAQGQLVYGYVDTSHTFTASLLGDLEPLVNADPQAQHETLIYALEGAQVLFGTRDGSPVSHKTYSPDPDVGPAPVTLAYDAFHPESSPLLDLVYATSQLLADPSTDMSLPLAKDLLVNHLPDVARAVGDGLYGKAIADKHPEATIPSTSTLWDEMIDLSVAVAQEPGLLEDVLHAFADDATAPLGGIFSSYAAFNDRISYDRGNLNGPPFNFATNSTSVMVTPVDRTKADTGANRSALQRFVQTIHDTNGTTVCNKEGAVVHARGVSLLGNVDICAGGLLPFCGQLGTRPFHECEVFKIDNVSAFYLDAIVGKANLYFRPSILRSGLLGIGAPTVDTIQQSSGIQGFWDPPTASTFRPTPQWLNRLVFFDLQNDSTTSAGANYVTNHFLTDLQGQQIGTSVCPERLIPDPVPGAPDASPDGQVHGLRACQDGDWFFQRDQDNTFVWENFGFYRAITPLATAFANHKREDLFVGLMEILHKHWGDSAVSADECKLGVDAKGVQQNCTREGAVTYEPLLVDLLASDLVPALHQLAKTVSGITVPQCTATDPTTHACTAVQNVDGVTVLAESTRALMDPTRAAAQGLTDRAGNVTSMRNDGTTNPQVTPLYLVLQALRGIDARFAAYAAANPSDTQRQAHWLAARSQLVDQFLDVAGQNTANATFKNGAVPAILPVVIDLLRAQMWARCPSTYTSPGANCTWARHDLTANMATTVSGPTFAAAMDLADAIRRDDAARANIEQLLAYLLNAASDNEALAAVLGSVADTVQVMGDDKNVVPLLHVLSEAFAPSVVDGSGHVVQKSIVDAQLSMLARLDGRAYDDDGTEICARELDANQVMQVALGKLVTPMTDATTGQQTETPLELFMDVVADVNRADPGSADKLQGFDYASITDEVQSFLLDPQRGMEQFYAIVRNGTATK
jgi:hypothetical protein